MIMNSSFDILKKLERDELDIEYLLTKQVRSLFTKHAMCRSLILLLFAFYTVGPVHEMIRAVSSSCSGHDSLLRVNVPHLYTASQLQWGTAD